MDPVTLEVLRNGFEAAAEEMNAALVRTGYSPNITERMDCSTALFDAAGRMVAQAETMPVHLGAMPFSVAAATDAFPPDELGPGDSILLNDPFRGGAHLPDLTLVTPVYEGGNLLGFAANRAHHADIGGSAAGSVAADSTEIYQEGLRIPPVKFIEGGEVNRDVLDLVLANVRTPDERRGDLRAQEAANETGRERLGRLVAEHGAGSVREAFSAVQDYSERRMRAEIADLPDGTHRFSDVIEDDGRGNEDLPIEAAVAIDGESVTVDFAGTADQTAGPVNAVRAGTVSATYFALRAVTDPDIPPNEGCYRPITVETPAGSLVNPDPPAAVVGGNLETSQRVTDTVLGALAGAVPDAVPAAGQGTMNNVTVGGMDTRDGGAERDTPGASRNGKPYAVYETQAGGFGGRAGGDGMDAVHVHMSNTRNTAVEVLETAYPLRVRRYALREGSGGAGEFRGGLGLRRDIELRGDATVSLLAERHRTRPYGLAGGEPGASGAAFVDGERVPAKTTRDCEADAVVSVRTPGGGGYGDPAEREAEAVLEDLRLGKISVERAARYGVSPGSETGNGP
jgi:N-methylhydantoinase B